MSAEVTPTATNNRSAVDTPPEGRPVRREGFEVSLRKFFRDVQQSGILSEIKKRRFREKKLSRTRLRSIARRKASRKRIKRGY